MWEVLICSNFTRDLYLRAPEEKMFLFLLLYLDTSIPFPSPLVLVVPQPIRNKELDSGRELGSTMRYIPCSSQLGQWRSWGSQKLAKVIYRVKGKAGLGSQGCGLQAASLPSCRGAYSRIPVSTTKVRLTTCTKGILQNDFLIINAYIFSWPQAKSLLSILFSRLNIPLELVTLPLLACWCRYPSISLLSRDCVCSKDYNFILGLDILITF